MERVIRLDQFGSIGKERLRRIAAGAALEAKKRLKNRTPVKTGVLKNGWKHELKPAESVVFNNVEYAAPIVAGQNLPPSWGGEYRPLDREPFLDIVAKDMQTWIEANASRIASS